MKEVYVCSIKILGFPFAVLTEEEAKKWVAEDPESNYYNKIEVKDLTA